MKPAFFLLEKILLVCLFFSLFLSSEKAFCQEKDSLFIRRIYDEALLRGECYQNLRHLCKKIGHRLSGSEGYEKSVAYTHALMQQTGIGKSWLQSVKIPKWERGAAESCFITYTIPEEEKAATINIKPIKLRKSQFPITALGMSVGTGSDGISGQVIELSSFSALDSLDKSFVKDKIVFFNHPFDASLVNTFDAYGEAGKYRYLAAVKAGHKGAKGTIVRSMTLAHDDYPHTGAMTYRDTVPKIPACAISTNGADSLSKLLQSVKNHNLTFIQNCKTHDDVMSSNVIGEIKGSSHSDEVILIGAHLDSWDLAEGAHDDGAGCVQTIEVMRIFKALGYQPKRTIRFVLFANEENGLKGSKAYAETYGKDKHIFALESDAGGFTPRGFSLGMSKEKKAVFASYAKLLKPYLASETDRNGGGADISVLEERGVPVGDLEPDSQRYFDCHHSALDVFENVNRRELELGAAAIASVIYLISENGL
jgi:hypothetical protein